MRPSRRRQASLATSDRRGRQFVRMLALLRKSLAEHDNELIAVSFRVARCHLLSLGDVKNPEAQPWGGGVFAPFSANSQTTPRRRSRSANTLAAITEAPSTTHNRRLTSSAVCSIELATFSAS